MLMELQTWLGPRVVLLAAQIIQEEPRVNFTHCYGHAVNLAAGDAIKKNKLLRNALDTRFEISKLPKYFPRHYAIFQIKAKVAPDTPSFRPTRWTVRASSLQGTIDNYLVFQELWEEAVEIVGDSEVRARIGGISAAMEMFDCLFHMKLLGSFPLHSTPADVNYLGQNVLSRRLLQFFLNIIFLLPFIK